MLHDRVVLSVDAGLEEPIHGVHEVVAVGLGVKAQDARAEHSLEQLVAPGADAEPLRVGPGDVPEHDDGRPGQPLANEARHEGEVIVLNEDDRIFGVHLLTDGVGELLVDGLVVLPVLASEDGAGVREVAERPEALVGEAVVVALLFFGREPDPPDEVGLFAGRHADPPVLVGRLSVRGAAAVGDPDSGAGAHDRLERGDETARRMNDDDTAVLGPFVDVGFPIRDDDDFLAVQVAVERLLEPLRRPVAALAVGFFLGDDAIDELADIPQDRPELGVRRPASEEASELVAPTAPGQPGRDRGHGGGGHREKPESQQQEVPRLGFSSFDEAQIVHEDDESERLISVEHGNGADVNVAAGQRHDTRPGAPAAAGSPAAGRTCFPSSSQPNCSG